MHVFGVSEKKKKKAIIGQYIKTVVCVVQIIKYYGKSDGEVSLGQEG